MLSSLDNLVHFGLLTGFAIVMAVLADITITPALLTLVVRTPRSDRPERSGCDPSCRGGAGRIVSAELSSRPGDPS